MAKKAQKRQPEPPKQSTVVRQDTRAALEDKTLSKKEGKSLSATHGRQASQEVARKLSTGKYTVEKNAGKSLGLDYQAGRNQVSYDPRAHGKSQTYYERRGSLGSFGAVGLQDEKTRWKYPQNAPGQGWYVKGYRRGEDGSMVPIYGYGPPGSSGGNGKNGNGKNGNGKNGNGRNSWMDAMQGSIDPLEEQIWQQAQDSMSQIDYFDQMLNDMLASMGDLSGTGSGFGYTVGVTGSDGAQNTYYTDPLGRVVPDASTLTVPLT